MVSQGSGQSTPENLVNGSTVWNASAAAAIEQIATQSSATVYIYDVAEQVAFGALTESQKTTDASVVKLQTRAGAGLGLVGRLSEGTSNEVVNGSILTAYTTPIGLAAMSHALTYLPSAAPTAKLIIQVATVTPIGENLALSSTLSSLSAAWHILPAKHMVILASATPQESIDLAALAYQVNAHVIHFFDYLNSTREVGNNLVLPPAVGVSGLGIHQALKASGYAPFDYFGDKNAKTVAVFLNGPLALSAKAANIEGLGIVVVRLVRPWNEDAFQDLLPSEVKEIHVFDDVPHETTPGNLYMEVLGMLAGTGKGPVIRSHRVTPNKEAEYTTTPKALHTVLRSFSHGHSHSFSPLHYPTTKKMFFFGPSQSAHSTLPQLIRDTLKCGPNVSARILTEQDAFTSTGGITADRLVLTQSGDPSGAYPVSVVLPFQENTTDFLGIWDQNLLATHSILHYAKEGSAVLIVTPWTGTEFVANIPRQSLALLLKKHVRVYLFNPAESQLSGSLAGAQRDAVWNALVHSVFIRLYLGPHATELTLRTIGGLVFDQAVEGIPLAKIIAHSWIGLREVELPSTIPEAEENGPAVSLKSFEFNTISAATSLGDECTPNNTARLSSWHDAAKHILFPLAFAPTTSSTEELSEYSQIPTLRPEVPERTFLATCTVNRRLTPIEYDRNVFHLEFSTAGTGLKYAIGEALGVYGWNDEQDVLDFCKWYKVDPNQLVTIPIAAGSDVMHTRTVFQALQQQVDLFGRPPKSFYSDLAEHATDTVDRHALLFIGSPEGSYALKKLSEKDTVNFVDVLQLYPSAHPSIELLCEMVGDIKPRHYSIASAQAVVGDQVDLLVVSVDWVTPSGSPRYGQCTRYLAGLKVGQKVTVSIKPSVMKLPPNSTQPIIMAGLGTGAAPFRAFLQYTAWLSQQGIPTGPVYYYFGSRYQAQEYLYGEEIEAYILGGTITKAGLAFSRDGKKKVYIQHLMLEDAGVLAKMLKSQEGVFYLCGPTWPVPDVYEALVGALVKYEGHDAVTAGEYLESLKEEERYVLEVY